MAFQFEWDARKAALNIKAHAVSFEQAITVFDDGGAIEGYDLLHSVNEDRFVRIGLSDVGVLVVVFTMRIGNIFRIISARHADHDEEKNYYEYQAH